MIVGFVDYDGHRRAVMRESDCGVGTWELSLKVRTFLEFAWRSFLRGLPRKYILGVNTLFSTK